MKKVTILIVVLWFTALTKAAEEPKFPALPAPVASNAVASLKSGFQLYSIMGMGPKQTWNDVSNKLYILHLPGGKWSEGHSVPGVAGRLGASAAGAKGKVFLFGGYVIENHGGEIVVPDVNAYVPEDKRWYRAADIPTPVGQAVIGVSHDRYIYLIGGLSADGPVNKVQVYDAEKNTWSDGTPSPGAPVYGHAGALVDDTIIYVAGAMKSTAASGPRFVASDECWMGKIDRKDPHKIEWSKLPAHPGTARFGIAAGGADREHKIFFSGGTATSHNYHGLDSEGKPVDPVPVTFDFDLHHGSWELISDATPDPRTDARGILSTRAGNLILGGMLKDQKITAEVQVLPQK